MDLSKFFVKAPLIPVVCQDERNGEVLMLGYANEEALQLTMDTGTAWFFSRSRQKLWNKGETSGNVIFVSKIHASIISSSGGKGKRKKRAGQPSPSRPVASYCTESYPKQFFQDST